MINTANTLNIDEALQQQRQIWLNAYQKQDTDSMSLVEAKDFFVVYYQNVEKKSDWHHNVQNSIKFDDVLMILQQSTKSKCECFGESCIITSYFKDVTHNKLLKEMWTFQKQTWVLSSLALNQSQLTTV